MALTSDCACIRKRLRYDKVLLYAFQHFMSFSIKSLQDYIN